MREKKFRVILKGKVVGYERLTEKGWQWMYLELNPDDGERWCSGCMPHTEGFIRNQFIGLKDKKENDLYAEDILKYDFYHPTQGKIVYTGVVSFDEGKASFAVEFMDGEFHYFGETVFKNASEVIGNLSETPDLLP